MSPAAVACPNCRVRLKVAAPSQEDKSFSCPKCGHAVVVPGLATHTSSSHTVLLLALIAAVLVMGGGIIAAVIMTQTPRTPDKTVTEGKDNAAKEAADALAKEQEKKLQEENATKAEKEKAEKEKADRELENADKEKRRQDYLRWMIEGGTAVNSQKLPEAFAAYQEALKALPGDAAASQKLREVKTALDEVNRAKLSDEKYQADLKKLLDQADMALDKKQYAAAAEIYKLLLQRNPGDAAAAKGLIAAQNALAKDDAERKKQADFQKHLAAGQAALGGGRYADAVAEFAAAQLVLPMNVQAAGLQREAEKLLAFEKNRKDVKAEYDRLTDLGAASLRNQRFDDAIASYMKALQLVPNDPLATKGLADARLALQNVAGEFDVLMARGANAMRDFRFRDAIDAYREATRLAPGNEAAAASLRLAEVAFENRATYVVAMKRGRLALKNLLYDEAAAAFTDALRILPNDPLAAAGLRDAQKGLIDFGRRRKDADALIQTGTTAAKQRKYAEAAKAFKDALKILPTHPQADTIRTLLRYNDNMAEGTADLNARRYPEAIRHFQAALAEVPNDFNATAGLNRARAMNNKN
jgi:tetratricopeptide (TPR) repeat protein